MKSYGYDLVEDWGLVVASFQSQYSIRLKEVDLDEDEFFYLLSGLDSETPLGRIVQIRTETDKDRLKYFTPEMKRIRQEWIEKCKAEENITEEQQKQTLEYGFYVLENMFRNLGSQ